jgi:hypothetical protein
MTWASVRLMASAVRSRPMSACCSRDRKVSGGFGLDSMGLSVWSATALGKQLKVLAAERLQKAVLLLHAIGCAVDYRGPSNPLSVIPMRKLPVAALTLCAAFLAGCSDSSGPKLGPLTTLAIKAGGDNQTALAGTVVSGAIIITPTDNAGRTIPGESATFAVIAGGGTIANTTGTLNADGTFTAPAWTLGKSVVPQQLQVTIAGKTAVINATVRTSYKVDLRFFGRTLTASQSALFTNAAARIRALVTGQPPVVNGAGASPSSCGATGVADLTSGDIIDGVLIYASIDSIDGKDSVLAQSGPCYVRSDADVRTAIGIMKFDSADINSLDVNGNLQEVILHEMLHVVGIGVYWDSLPGNKNLLINYGPNVAYIGAGGIAGCKAFGAVNTCATSVPVEGSQGGDGTINSHWRETTFGNELMTGFLNRGTNPLSVMSIRSLEDLGYVTNPADADTYPDANTVKTWNLRASFRLDDISATPTPGVWEKPLKRNPRSLPSGISAQNLRSSR